MEQKQLVGWTGVATLAALMALIMSSWGVTAQVAPEIANGVDLQVPGLPDPESLTELPVTDDLRGRLPAGAVELLEYRELNSKTYRLLDGSMVARISQSPLHYVDADGQWADISTALVPTADGFENTANALQSRFGAGGAVSVARGDAHATWTPSALALRYWDGEAYEELRATTQAAPVALGEQIRYAEVLPGAMDLYNVERSFVKHDVVFDAPPAFEGDPLETDHFVIDGTLSLSDGLRIFVDGEEQTGDFIAQGTVEFMNPDGSLAFRLYGVFAYDSLFPEMPEDEELTSSAADGWLRGTYVGDQLHLSIELPTSWLFADERVYPVTIDPSWGWDDADTTIYARERHGNLNGHTSLYAGAIHWTSTYTYSCGWNGWSTCTGTTNHGDAARPFIRQSLSPIDNRVTAITDVLVDFYADSVAATNTIQGHFVSSDSWTATGLTWANQPAATTSMGSVSVSSNGWKTLTPAESLIEGQLSANHVDKFNGDDQFSYRYKRDVETCDCNQYARMPRTGTQAPEWLVYYDYDTTAPSTSITNTGTAGDNGWFTSSVSSTLACSDTGGAGCYQTDYRRNNGAWADYSSAISTTAEGTTTLGYRSQDKVLNWAGETTSTIKIDTVAPATTSSITGTAGDNDWYTDAPEVSLSCSDATSGCASTEYRINDGSWTAYSDAVTIDDEGENDFEYRSKDLAGNVGSIQSLTIKVDTELPSVSHTLSGTAGDAGWYKSAVSITLSSADDSAGIDDTEYRLNSGSWQAYTSAVSVSTAGTTTFDYRTTDNAGNVKTVTGNSFKIDQVAPTTSRAVSGTAGSGGWYTSTPSVTLTCSDATSGCSETQYRINNGAWQGYSSAVSIAGQGSNTFDYRSKDAAGNWQSIQTSTIKVDTTLPSISHSLGGTSGSDGWYRSAVSVTLTASDAHSGVSARQYRINSGAWQNYVNPFSLTNQGTTTVDYRATDTAGNTRTVTGTAVKIDTVNPSTVHSLDGVLGDGGWYISDVGVTLTGSDASSGLDYVQYRVDGGSWTTYSSQFDLTANGARSVDYRSVDHAGNTEAIDTVALKIDTVDPIASINLAGTTGSNGWYISPVTFSLAATDATSGADRIYWRTNGGSWQLYTAAIQLTNQGTTNLEYYAVDAAGNDQTVQSSTIKIDTTAPSTVRTLTGTLGGGGWYTTSVEVSLNPNDATSGVQDTFYRVNGGAWQTYGSPFIVSGEGTTLVEYYSTDVAGNQASTSSVNVNIDTIVPRTLHALDGVVGRLNWFLSAVTVTLDPSDASSGVDITEYRVGTSGAWNEYTGPFQVSNPGMTDVFYRSRDVAGNQESANSFQLKIDQELPVTVRDLTGTAGAAGWFVSQVQAALSCTDSPSGCDATEFSLDGGSSFQEYTGAVTLTEGTTQLRERSTDVAGNQEAAHGGAVRVDVTAPVTSFALSGDGPLNGWFRSAVQMTLDCADGTSGCDLTRFALNGGGFQDYTGPVDLSANGVTSAAFRSTDVAGNTEADLSRTIRIDQVLPNIAHTLTGTLGGENWHRSVVQVLLDATDAHSGIDLTEYRLNGGAWQPYSGAFDVSTDGVTSLDYRTTDLAGNVRTITGVDVKVDQVLPDISHALSGSAGDAGWYVGAVEVVLSAVDGHSGISLTQYRVNGGGWQTYEGAFSVASEGLTTIDYRTTDVAGNTRTVSGLEILVDTIAPVTTIGLSGDGPLNNWFRSAVQAALAATDGTSGVDRIQYRINEGGWQTYTDAVDISAEGLTNLQVRAVDAAGNTESVHGQDISIDLTAPVTASALNPAPNANGWINDAVSVTLSPDDALSGVDRVRYRVDGGNWADGTSFQLPNAGTYLVEYYTIDRAGNSEGINSLDVRIDLTAPASAISLTGDGPLGGWFKGTVSVALSAVDEASGIDLIEYSLDGGAWQVYSGAFDIAAAGLTEVQVRATDGAGNTQTPISQTIQIDLAAPETTHALNPLLNAAGWARSAVEVTLASTDDLSGVGGIEYRLDDGNWITGTAVTVTGDGAHRVEYRATDVAGNVEEIRSVDLSLDTVAPDTSHVLDPLPNANGWNVQDVLVTLNPRDATSGVATTFYRVDGGDWVEGTAVTVSGEAVHTVDYYSRDVAENEEAVRSAVVSIDVTVPEVTHTLTGTVGDAGWFRSAVELVLDATDATSGVDQTFYTVDSAGEEVYTAAVTITGEGAHSASYRTVDLAGLQSDVGSLDLSIDTVAPTTTLDLTGPLGGGNWFLDAVTASLSAVDATSGVSKIFYSLDGSDFAEYTGEIAVTGDGVHSLAYFARDAAGNVEATTTGTISIDTTAASTVANLLGSLGNGNWYVSTVNVVLTATDAHSGVDFIEYNVDGAGWETYTGAVPVPASGSHIVDFRATDVAGNVEEVGSIDFRIDVTDPVSLLHLAGTLGDADWYTSAVDFTLSATDTPSGVDRIEYRLDTGAWRTYSAAVPVTADGLHEIRHFSVDNAGNQEAVKRTDIKIDATVPTTLATLTGALGNDGWYLGDVRVALEASDAMSGVREIQYRLNDGDWTTYTSALTISAEGLTDVDFRAIDAAGNVEPSQRVRVSLDPTAPASELDMIGTLGNGDWFLGDVSLELSATDATSAVREIRYSLDGAGFEVYSGAIAVTADGVHTIRWQAEDIAGNVEAVQQATVKLDATVPETQLDILGPLVDLGTQFVTSATTFTLAATDATSDVAAMQYRIDGTKWTAYEGPFSLDGADGARLIEYRAIDVAGNTEPANEWDVTLDNTAPTVDLGFAGPHVLEDVLNFVTGSTQIILTANDGGVGVANIRYQLDQLAERDFRSFALTGADGAHAVQYFAQDLLGNRADTQMVELFLDNTAPISALLEGLPNHVNTDGIVYVTSHTPMDLQSDDPAPGGDAVGVDVIEYRMDGGAWTPFTDSFEVPTGIEAVTVEFRAVDRLGNLEATQAREFRVDDIAPDLAILSPRPASITVGDQTYETDSDGDGMPDVLEAILGTDPHTKDSGVDPHQTLPGWGELTSRAYAVEGSLVLFDLDAVDRGGQFPVGVKELQFYLNGELQSVDTGAPYEWGWDTAGLMAGEYQIRVVAVDHLGNANEASMMLYLLPGSTETAAVAAVEAIEAAKPEEPEE